MVRSSTPLTFDQVIAFVNDTATHAKRIHRYLSEITTTTKQKIHVVDITGYNAQKVHTIVDEQLSRLRPAKRTLLVVGGGDGTVSSIVHGIVHSPAGKDLGNKLVVLPLWGGNANDVATMLNGLITSVNISKILQTSEVVAIHPLQITLQAATGQRQDRVATGYVSFGVTAEASHYMESSSHARGAKAPRNLLSRVSGEIADFWKAVIDFDGFQVESQKNGSHHMYERLFVNGSRIARIPNTAVKLHERQYMDISAPKKHLHLLVYGFKAFFRQTHGSITDEERDFTIKDATMAQIDGEVIGVEPHTHVHVAIHPTPVYMLSRKL